ncbi:glycoside hydrolase family 27 protein [Chitinophaga polysaccharea]|uniref:glycoside hydrolase family 27 protein n=1 Tax=Chitinophaga TaxID=79328 RepID=UPI0014557E3B|nr:MULTISPECIES: glycoside hydrolase family 27 protein [Chitinophaga]NLR61658.1 glycoside hydrolase family 27 protein [Chitinophaga polysaccharea]NLU93747.1 glycoside hydrolase family 27 protein [Chitinophaga sp. Ak27]
MKRLMFWILVLLVANNASAQKFEGLAPTPPMGWNSWNTFQTAINEKMIMEIADALVSSGMKDAGYHYLVLDDGWMAMERDSLGNLIPDPVKFPHGLKVVVDYVHAKGLKFGLYNCAGTLTCAKYPGTRGYEYQDARNYAAWNIDYLKFDWCNTNGINAKEAYTTMSRALRKAGHPMIFSLCEWGVNKPWQWGEPVGQLWRTTEDIYQVFDSVHNQGTWDALSVMRIADLQDTLRKYAGPDHWNDPDMLEVGNGMTYQEDKTHFSLWAMMAAPLMAGNDIRKMTPQTKAILTNRNIIAIDQDPLGIQGFKYADKDSLQVWFKPLQQGDWAVCFVNRSSHDRPVTFNWKQTPVVDAIFHYALEKNADYALYNVWTGKQEGTTEKNLNAILKSHDVLMFRLKK